MKVNDIRSLASAILLSCICSEAAAQHPDSSIFSKPLNIEATVKTERLPRSEQKGDTLIFNAAAYQVIENADSERLISKMPGISVSDSGIEANGKEVMRILLDGQEFFGNDVLTALRNIPADMVKQIEVINRLSNEAQLTGVDDGEGHMAINIVTKRKKGSGHTAGRVYGSYGLSEMPGHKNNYITGGNLTHFTDDRTISVIGMGNNISKFNFTSSEILSGSTNLDAGGSSSFKVKALAGISDVHSLGANYSSKNCKLTYFYNNIINMNTPVSDKFTSTATAGKELHTHNENDYRAYNMTHKLDGKFTISPEKRHTVIIQPSFTFEDQYNARNLHGRYSYVYADAEDEFRRKQLNINDNDRWTIRASNNITYRYKFDKRRRSLSIFGRYGLYRHSALDKSWEYRWTEPDADTENLDGAYYTYTQKKDRSTLQQSIIGKMTYTEPVSARSLLSVVYTYQSTHVQGGNLIYPFQNGEYTEEPKTRVSSKNTSSFSYNKVGIRYNYTHKKTTVAVSSTYQNTVYTGNVELPGVSQTRRIYHHPLYMLTVNLPFNKSNTLRIEANSRTQAPSNTMLQDIVDRSSTSNVRAGNPDLLPAYLHEAEIRYINTNKVKGTTFSITAEYTGSNNYFCDSLVINNPDFIVMKDDDGKDIKLGKDNQFAKPINLDGYHKFYFLASLASPIDVLRSNFNVSLKSSIQRLPGIINEDKIPINRNWFELAGRLDSNISKNIDFTVSYLARYNMNDFNGKFGRVENNYMFHLFSSQLKWIFFNDFSFTGAFIYKKFKNTQGRYDDDFYLCDLFLGKRFLKNKRLEINIGVNDLFNNNIRTYAHSISASGRTDSESIGIGRYCSIQAIWHFRSESRQKSVSPDL